jgi:UDP-N-acetylglucosamine acyltransferase
MTRKISPLACVDPGAELGNDLEIGPFCVIGPDVTLGDGCRLLSHVTIVGHVDIGQENRFWPGVVIGGEPQDTSYQAGRTRVSIGDDNQFREGVTVNRGAEKEDAVTRIGNNNLLMANSHVAHNCHVFNQTILVNGVLLGGHVHVHDGAIVSGNTVVHHYSTIGTLAFVSGGCRVPHDIPPYMLAAGSDNPTIRTLNLVGLRRRGISERSIALLKEAHRLLFRQNRGVDEVQAHFSEQLDGIFPIELTTLLHALQQQREGKMGRAREIYRTHKSQDEQQDRSVA